MKLLSFSAKPNEPFRLGAIHNEKVIDLAKAYSRIKNSQPPVFLLGMKEFLASGEQGSEVVRNLVKGYGGVSTKDDFVFDVDGVFYYPPVPNPEKILCVAVNYRAHAKEAGLDVTEEPYVFMKHQSTLIGHKWPILIPKAPNSKADHEIELVAVIGVSGKYITKENAYRHVMGYTIFNDVSFRDRRTHSSPRYVTNWLHLKNLDTAAPVGPWIVTKDEIPDPHNLRISLKVNGEARQDSSTSNMIHTIPELVEYISNGITLKPGDIISTGTPPGVGMVTGKYLNDGDVLTGEIEKIGTLVNPVKRESPS